MYNPEFLYLTTTGRRTGQAREIEIWFVEHDDLYYLCAQNRERADWVRNIQANPTVAFWANGRSFTGSAAPLAPDDPEARKVKQLFDEVHGWSDGLLVRLKPEQSPAPKTPNSRRGR